MNLDRLKKTAPWALALMIAMATQSAFAQTVDIGGTNLELGASRADTLAVANAQFDVAPTSVRNQYTIYPKREPGMANDGRYPKAIGTLTIQNDRLVRVTRNLGSFRSTDGEAAMENLIAAFANAPNAGDTPAVHTDSGLAGGASTSRVYFSYPDRAIQIVIYRPADSRDMATVDITEQYALRGSADPMTAR
ncbi:hypothetical protein [Salinisphaera aquimarina]|uniref:Uncharacterized protein n=1 Tax=Salinisphaera aquimarina TaxID=2094031 RepID=A0ABV7ENG9_9GAMM